MDYLWIKWLHILSSTILFGTGLGIAFFQWMSWRTGELAVIARITRLTVLADGQARFTTHLTDPISAITYIGSCEVAK